jgi:hypothetical protein
VTAPATTTTAAATATAATTATTTGSLFRFVDLEGSPVEIGAVHRLHGALGLFTRAHGDKAETTRLTRGAIRNEVNVNDFAMCCERVAQHVLR